MLTVDQMRSLEPGDVVEMGKLFKKLTDEPVVWTVVETDPVARKVVFDASYFGVNIGVWECVERKEALEWEKVG
jgi:hypothetical protein